MDEIDNRCVEIAYASGVRLIAVHDEDKVDARLQFGQEENLFQTGVANGDDFPRLHRDVKTKHRRQLHHDN